MIGRMPPVKQRSEGSEPEQAPGLTPTTQDTVRIAIDRARTIALAARIARGKAPRAAVAPPSAEQVAARETAQAERAVVRPKAYNSRHVYEWWVAALLARYGDRYRPPTWTRAQQAKAKAVVVEYGPEMTQAVIAAVVAAAQNDLPTIDALHAARQRAFHEWQTRGMVSRLGPWEGSRRGGRTSVAPAASVRDARKNFDEFEWGDTGPKGRGGAHG
jgi:hypothetical protein